MQIERVSFKNFGSYGNKLLTLEIPDIPSFWLVSGKNGNGKSTLSDVIKFALYGKLENKKLKDMANRLNKNAYVKVELNTNKGKVEIERGIEPSLFKLKIAGKEIDKAGKRSVQEFLEEEYLEMPFYVFSNTLSLSINDFKSFLKMSSFDKKAIIDKIFGLQILNQMREVLKYQTKKLKENVDDLSTSISAFNRSLESTQREFNILEKKILENSSEKKVQLSSSRALHTVTIEKHTNNLQKISKKMQQVENAKKQMSESMGGDNHLILILQEKIELYENAQCPTCQADLQTDFHKEHLKQYEMEKIEATQRVNDRIESLNKLKSDVLKLEKMKNDTRRAITTSQVELKHINESLNEIGEIEVDDQTESLKNMMLDFNEKIKEKKEEQLKSQKTISFYNLAEEILGEKGVKQLAIKSILPPLNSEIAKLIKTLGLEHRIVFNDEFDAKITHFGVEVSPDTLSTGEMKKADFAVLLAVIRMMKMKYPFMNMLFLDEIFSSIDHDGQYHILKILRDIVKEYKMNIFVISHYPLSYTEFDYRVEILKNSGFSSFNIEKVN